MTFQSVYSMFPVTQLYRNTQGSYAFVDLYGYKNAYNPHDSRVMCGSAAPCNPAPSTRSFSLRVQRPSFSSFKIYFPAGSTTLYLMLLVPKNAQIGVAMRWNAPPTGTYRTFADIPVDDDKGIPLSQPPGADYTARTSGGHR